MIKKTVIINRAVPGSGKTTITNVIVSNLKSKGIPVSIHSTDEYFMKDNSYDFKPEKLAENHRKNLEAFIRDMEKGIPLVICDNTNLSSWQSEPYIEAARQHNYQIIIINFTPRELEKHVETQIITDERPDAHGIPPEDLIDKLDEYNRNLNLLDKSKPVTEENYREIWDNEINDTVKSDKLLNHYDLDHLINYMPEYYHDKNYDIGAVILSLMEFIN